MRTFAVHLDGRTHNNPTVLAEAHCPHLGAHLGHPGLVVAGDVGQKDHLGLLAAGRLGRVAHRPDVPLIEMFQAGQDHVALVVDVVLDLGDCRHRLAQVLAVELQAHGSNQRRHPVQHEDRRTDQAVTTFLLDPGQAAQELVGDILAQALLAQGGAGHTDDLRLADWPAFRRAAGDSELDLGLVMDLAEIVIETLDVDPVALRIDHPPGGEVVQRGSPQHRFLPARVHRHVTADGRGILRGRIDREYEPGRLGAVGHPAGDHAGIGTDGGYRSLHPG